MKIKYEYELNWFKNWIGLKTKNWMSHQNETTLFHIPFSLKLNCFNFDLKLN